MRRLLGSLVLVITLASTHALARSEKTLAYPRDQVWPTAVRFLVVDERVKVLEKDPDAGYVMFELKDQGKTFRGSLEVMSVTVDKRTRVRFVLQIEDRPDWVEVAMLGRLERKLRQELGAPAPGPSKDRDGDNDRPKDGEPKPPSPPPADDGGPPISPTP